MADGARQILHDLGGYSDAQKLYRELAYQQGVKEFSIDFDYVSAMRYLEQVKEYKDADSLYAQSRYRYATNLYLSGEYEEALDVFESLGDYVNSKKYAEDCRTKIAESQQKSDPET